VFQAAGAAFPHFNHQLYQCCNAYKCLLMRDRTMQLECSDCSDCANIQVYVYIADLSTVFTRI